MFALLCYAALSRLIDRFRDDEHSHGSLIDHDEKAYAPAPTPTRFHQERTKGEKDLV